MQAVHNMVEIYSVDWSGIYPDTYDDLGADALTKNYAKELVNPVTHVRVNFNNHADCTRIVEFMPLASIPANTGTTLPYTGPGGTDCGGQVMYAKTAGNSTAYGIYGLDSHGEFIFEHGQILEFSNS